ncbi:MAG: pilus assembly protein PilM [Chitinispirillales bacterium]|jgi:Tfp pilus assembly PilM family ATPase|nr:pilus assembly protein PilM [Chitinispirillales bacterium]
MPKSAGTNGIDIQRDYLCAAQYSPQEMAVRQVVVQPLASESPEEFWESVSHELSGLRKKVKFAGSKVVCSVPCDMAVVKTLEAESDERDQGAILRWELEASLLGGIGEYAYDFYEVDPGNVVERRRYLAAALRKETLAKLKKAVKRTKLDPYIVDIDLFALTNVFQANYREQSGGAAVLVLGERRRTKMILVNNSSYADSGVVEYDVRERGADGYAAELRDEVARLVSANLGGASAAVYLAGSLFADSAIAASALGAVAGSEMLNPFRKLQCAAEIDASQLAAYSSQLAVSVGLALRGEEAP